MVTDREENARVTSTTCPSCGLTAAHQMLITGRDHLVGAPGSFSVIRCNGCGLAFTWPQLRGEDFSVFYPEASYPAYLAARPSHGAVKGALDSWAFRRRARSVRKGPYRRYFSRPPGALLDVGCGIGHHGAAFRECGWVVHGIEPSASAAREAERRGLIVHHGTLEDASAPLGPFDLVIFNHSLEHIPHPSDTLRRAYSLLEPGGEIAVAVPDFGCWQRRLFRERWFHLDLPRHLQHFTSATLASLAAQVGFRDVSITRYPSPNGLPNSIQYALLGHLILPRRGRFGRITAVVYRLLRALTCGLPGDHLLLTARRSAAGGLES
jgi:2-polyprenyl-3-methyl-5-hydroxy-6-metoxy-1,4-benzoquinol methylase